MALPKVAVIGYPNVGKSTLVNRLSGTREAVTHEQAGVTRDRKEVEAEWNGGAFPLVDTGGVDLGGPRDLARASAGAGAARARRRRRSPCWWSTPAPGLRPGDAELADELRRSAVPARGRGEQARRRRRRSRTRPSSTGSGSASRCRSRPRTGLGTGDLLDRVADASRARSPERDEDDGVAARRDRPAERRQVLARERVPGRGARDRRRAARAPRATRSTRALEVDGRAARARRHRRAAPAQRRSPARSTTTRSCAPSARPSGPTSRSSSATRPRA